MSDDPSNVKILLSNGDLIKGDMYDEQFDVLPEVIGQLALGKPALRSIQLNAPKMVLKEYHSLPESDRDSDGDGVADDADKCPNSPWGFEVNEDGCSKDRNLAKGGNPFDQDRDGVLWIGTENGGLERLDEENERFIHYQHNPSDLNSLSSNAVSAIYEDDEGMLWIGTAQ